MSDNGNVSQSTNSKKKNGWVGPPTKEWLENRLSKRLCYLLRYGALKEGLHVDDHGFVDIEELRSVNLLREHGLEEVLEEIKTSTSWRKTKRFQWKEEHGKIYVRAQYARRLEKNPCHEDSKVPTLFEHCIQSVITNIEDYDLDDFPDEFIISTMIHRLKRQKKLNNKALQTLLVPALEHVDLEGLYLTNNILKMVWTKCPHIKTLSLMNCGYIMTDNLMSQLVKKLPDLTSLNLARCQHLTDITLKSIKKHSKKLRNINISMVRNFTEACVLDFIISLPGLEQVDMYDVRISTEGRETLAEIGKHRKLKIILYEFHSEEAAQKNPSEMLPNFGQVWY
ncbi:uncharacterized protein LOC124117349 [Haliotis rufescens]|uniref:uncharacterized protein LOC124117349 n=1 Tax=Haliotis rufescens TaxID=6454 RepID=UPI00201F6CDE|nr:uncharacterized protein LOC124117349 [Haliotis rufescens]